VVSELRLNRITDNDFWPAELPPLGEMEALGRDRNSGGHLYRLPGGMPNTNSGEHFEVVLLFKLDKEEGIETLSEMRLLFH
jgi:hypothetical protein